MCLTDVLDKRQFENKCTTGITRKWSLFPLDGQDDDVEAPAVEDMRDPEGMMSVGS